MDWFRELFADDPTLNGDWVVRSEDPHNPRHSFLIDYNHNGEIYRSLWDSFCDRRGNWVSESGDPLTQDTFQDRFFLKHLDRRAVKVLSAYQLRVQHAEEHHRLWGTDDDALPDSAADSAVEEDEDEDEGGRVFDKDGGVWRLLTEDG